MTSVIRNEDKNNIAGRDGRVDPCVDHVVCSGVSGVRFGDLWPNLPGQPSLSPTMAETRAEQDRQNRQEGFEVLPNVTGSNKFLFKRRWQKSFDS